MSAQPLMAPQASPTKPFPPMPPPTNGSQGEPPRTQGFTWHSPAIGMGAPQGDSPTAQHSLLRVRFVANVDFTVVPSEGLRICRVTEYAEGC